MTAKNPPVSSAAVLTISGSAPHRPQIVGGLPDHSVVGVGASDRDELARRLADPPAAVVIAGCAGPDEERELTLFAASRAPAAAIVVVGAGAPAPIPRPPTATTAAPPPTRRASSTPAPTPTCSSRCRPASWRWRWPPRSPTPAARAATSSG